MTVSFLFERGEPPRLLKEGGDLRTLDQRLLEIQGDGDALAYRQVYPSEKGSWHRLYDDIALSVLQLGWAPGAENVITLECGEELSTVALSADNKVFVYEMCPGKACELCGDFRPQHELQRIEPINAWVEESCLKALMLQKAAWWGIRVGEQVLLYDTVLWDRREYLKRTVESSYLKVGGNLERLEPKPLKVVAYCPDEFATANNPEVFWIGDPAPELVVVIHHL